MGPIVIIIDALDESGDTDSRRVLLRILGNTENRVTDPPPNLRILFTFRPLHDIYAALGGRTHIQKKSMDSLPPDSTQRDTPRHVSDQLSQVDFEIPSQEVFTSLTRSSGQIFEWARLACAYIRGDDAGTRGAFQRHHNPQQERSRPTARWNVQIHIRDNISKGTATESPRSWSSTIQVCYGTDTRDHGATLSWIVDVHQVPFQGSHRYQDS